MSPQVLTVSVNPAIDQTVTINEFQAGEVNRVLQNRLNAGGKGFNVALCLADYGVKVAATGILGRQNAALFETAMHARNVDDQFVRLPGETRVSIKVSDPALGRTTDINFPGLSVMPTDLEELTDRILDTPAQWVVLAGSTPEGVPDSYYAGLVPELRAKGINVAVDASGKALELVLRVAVDFVKPNLDELSEFAGRPLKTLTEVREVVIPILKRGTRCVVVSMGAEGAAFFRADRSVVVRPPKVDVVSTVGAGDAMVAGMVAGHLADLTLEEVARLATAFSLEAVGRIGSGLTSPATTREVAQLLEVQDLKSVL